MTDSKNKMGKNQITERNSTIDVLRLVLAVCVIYIHMQEFLSPGTLSLPVLLMNDVLLGLTRFAVPLFFVFSGYFVYSSEDQDKRHRIGHSIRKTSVLLFTGMMVYFVLGAMLNGFDILKSLTPKSLLNFVVFNDTSVLTRAGGGGILWWVAALLYIYILYFLAANHRKGRIVLVVISFVGYAIGLCIAPMYGGIFLDRLPLIYSRNFLFEGLLFFSIGYFVRHYESSIRSIPSNIIKRFLILSVIAYAFEQVTYILPDYHHRVPQSQTFILPIAATAVMLAAIRFPGFMRGTLLPALGRKLVLYIFLSHRAIIYIICRIFLGATPPVKDNPDLSMRYSHVIILFVVTILISFVAAGGYYTLKNHKFKIFRKRGVQNGE